MPIPTQPSDPTLVTGPLLYLWGTAPTTHDIYYARVVGSILLWLSDEDPFPDPPPDDEGMRPQPPPPPPPMPAYPLDELLEGLANAAPSSADGVAWGVVRAALATWLTYGPFGP